MSQNVWDEFAAQDQPTITCGFCGASLPEPAAVMAGWVPYYFDGQTEVSSPSCCECAAANLTPCDDGEWELSPPADQPIIIN
jgi:hypothetical protein